LLPNSCLRKTPVHLFNLVVLSLTYEEDDEGDALEFQRSIAHTSSKGHRARNEEKSHHGAAAPATD